MQGILRQHFFTAHEQDLFQLICSTRAGLRWRINEKPENKAWSRGWEGYLRVALDTKVTLASLQFQKNHLLFLFIFQEKTYQKKKKVSKTLSLIWRMQSYKTIALCFSVPSFFLLFFLSQERPAKALCILATSIIHKNPVLKHYSYHIVAQSNFIGNKALNAT